MKTYLLAAVAALALGGSAHADDAARLSARQSWQALSNSANAETNTAALLLSSTPICGYPHEMLKGAMEDLIASGRIDQNKVVAIAYAQQLWAEKDSRVQMTLCPGVMKIVNENNRQRIEDGQK